MNTEIILAVVIAVVCLVEIALIIYAIRSTNKRLSELESIPPFEPKATEYLSVRLSVLEKWMQSQQPPTEQPEAKAESRTFVNVYEDEDGRHISDIDHSSYQEAYELRDNISTYIETVEIIRHKKP